MEEKQLSAPWRTQRCSIHPEEHSGDIRLPNFISFSRATFPLQFWAPKDKIKLHTDKGKATPLANKHFLQLPLESPRLGGKAHYFYCCWIKVILHTSGLYSRPSNLGNRHQLRFISSVSASQFLPQMQEIKNLLGLSVIKLKLFRIHRGRGCIKERTSFHGNNYNLRQFLSMKTQAFSALKICSRF